MFTGLVTEVGIVTNIDLNESSAILTIKARESISQLSLGDSISVNGTCLTVTSMSGVLFTSDVMVQTLKLTSLGALQVGSQVNLELAATTELRLGGHIVQGHVDATAEVIQVTPGENWTQLDVQVPAHLMKYLVPQGSIALEGVSLTVGSLDDVTNTVSVWLIPETLRKTNLSLKTIGDKLNVEVDILAKYVERLLINRSNS
jgi:riboflavin synthase